MPEPIDVVTIDLSYLAIARAAPQLEALDVRCNAELIALVKPMFELGLARAPTDTAEVQRAVAAAERGLCEAGWEPAGAIASPVRGSRGAIEALVHARRC